MITNLKHFHFKARNANIIILFAETSKRRISMINDRNGKFINIGKGQSGYIGFVPSPLPFLADILKHRQL